MIRFFSTLLVCFSLGAHAQQITLSIEFEGMDNDDGKVLVAIKNQKGTDVQGAKVEIQNKKAIYTIRIPAGQYAISAFHDEDDNNKLNTNFMGIPNEKYGFSNNVRGTFGPPSLQDQLINMSRDTQVKIVLK